METKTLPISALEFPSVGEGEKTTSPETFSSNDLPAVDFTNLSDFNKRIDDAIDKFKANQLTSVCYQDIKNIQKDVDQYFVQHEKPETSQYMELMTQICQKLNDNPIVHSVTEQFMYKPSQQHCSYTSYINQPSSDIGNEDDSSTMESFFVYKNHQSRYKDIDQLYLEGYHSKQSARNPLSLQKGQSTNSNFIEIPVATPQIISNEGDTKSERVETQADEQYVELEVDIFTGLMTQAEELINQINVLLDGRRLLQANKLVSKIEVLMSECKALQLTEEQIKAMEEFKERNAQLIELISDEADLIAYNLKVLQDDDGWKMETQKGKIKIMYQYPDSETMSLRMESELDVPLKNLLCLGNEMNHFKEYLPFVEEGRMVKDIRRATKVGYALMDVPMISKRECYFYGVGYNLLHEYGSIPMVSKSIHSDPVFLKKVGVEVPKSSKYVKLDYKYYVFNITPLGPNKCFVKIVLNVDYKINFVPKSIQNWCARKFGIFFFEKIIKKASNFAGTVWESAMNEQKEFYDWLDSQINEFLQNTGLTDNSNTLVEARAKINEYLKRRKEQHIDD